MDGPAEGKPNWELIGQDSFDWIVEQMLIRDHKDADVVRIPNDAGGDGGIDIGVYYPNHTLIYQLKFYTDGFSTKDQSRKAQIKRSFESVTKPKNKKQKVPDKWILVIPCKYTDTIYEWVKSDVLTTVSSPPDFDLMDGPHLESHLLTRHSDLLARFSRDDHFESLVRLFHAEEATLEGGVSDLSSRLCKLNRVVAELDEHWTLGFDTNASGGFTFYPVAKHPKAQEKSPLGVRLVVDPAAMDEATRAAFENVVGFGIPGTVTVPEQAVHDIEWTGPKSIVPPDDWRTIEFGEASPISEYTGARMILSAIDIEGEHPSVHDGEVTRVACGAAGLSIQATFYRSVNITLTLPLDNGQGGRVDMKLDFAGCDPRDVSRGISFLYGVRLSSRLEASLNDLRFAMSTNSHSGEIDDDLKSYGETAAEIDTLQDRTTCIFPMPSTVSAEDRAWTKALLIILNGGIAPVPLWRFKGDSHPKTTIDGDNPRTALLTFKEFKIVLFGRDITIRDHVFLYHPNANITPTSEPDENGVTKFSVEGADDTVFLAYMPQRVRNVTEVTPWSIQGIPHLPYPSLPAGELDK
ncbi:hypothetical protein [Rhodococcus sp. MEB041]|uniref:hypothetical protein n=1 Tax=Rhodococcus sp. MEB041 TaxID=3040323 RepID=UPI00254AC82D|nr:hypothetical protein [Rhodococcus sp. MEB041]